jgi:uncharacterized protein YceH (UPF0502 family)
MQHFPEIQLTFAETRVLGCLLEKEILTPDVYPLSLNSLVTACNQTSSRYPVTTLSAEDVMAALRGLSEKYLVEKVLGGRTAKYEHCLPYVLSLQDRERAVLTMLLLRGAQTAGEIKQRTERFHQFGSIEEVEDTLTWFIEYPHGPLVRRVPVGGGRRVETFEHLLSTHPEPPEAVEPDDPAATTTGEDPSWRERIEAQIAALQREVAELRDRLG